MTRTELEDLVVDSYMTNILDNPETIRDALQYYMQSESTHDLIRTLKGFEFEDSYINSLTKENIV